MAREEDRTRIRRMERICTAIINTPNLLTCEETRTYAYTYTDCEGNMTTWSFAYTIGRLPIS